MDKVFINSQKLRDFIEGKRNQAHKDYAEASDLPYIMEQYHKGKANGQLEVCNDIHEFIRELEKQS